MKQTIRKAIAVSLPLASVASQACVSVQIALLQVVVSSSSTVVPFHSIFFYLLQLCGSPVFGMRFLDQVLPLLGKCTLQQALRASSEERSIDVPILRLSVVVPDEDVRAGARVAIKKDLWSAFVRICGKS
eukprot:scaffold1411_cov252-Pinguiococcus_pyrenoidosus.AAC.2